MQTGTDEGEKPGAKETERDREAVRDRNKEAEISRGRKYKATCGGGEKGCEDRRLKRDSETGDNGHKIGIERHRDTDTERHTCN